MAQKSAAVKNAAAFLVCRPQFSPFRKRGREHCEFSLDLRGILCYDISAPEKQAAYFPDAGVAQSVEQLIRNQQVAGSSPATSSKIKTQLSA